MFHRATLCAVLAMTLSVCLSATSPYCVKTAARIELIFDVLLAFLSTYPTLYGNKESLQNKGIYR